MPSSSIFDDKRSKALRRLPPSNLVLLLFLQIYALALLLLEKEDDRSLFLQIIDVAWVLIYIMPLCCLEWWRSKDNEGFRS
ncbi:hypothetical protein FNV43_RR11053 [Rhamnella rubrinervis]|uniref:Transmembrane protein n=1 Tax=Rhamnella rubrinervis TaxID=2594499 RepID=A0A8K0H4V2_9ROSA|nr:hypothetical protein FNV43_RR11053 [Rhamnella rubrinervis]